MYRKLILSAALFLLSFQARCIDYELPDINGNVQSFNQYLGKWVVVNYWATWCSTCIKELPELLALNKSSNDIIVIGINFEEISAAELRDFVTNQKITYPILRSAPIPVTAIGKVPALPTTYIISPEGNVVAAEVGLVSRRNIEDYIKNKRGDGVR